MHLAPSALEKKEFRETWQVTALRDRVRTRYFQRKETKVLQEARRFPCVPCFIFPKTSWNVSNRSFPVLTVLSVWMTGASSATSSTSSSTDFSGRMFLMSTARTDPCTTVLSGGVSAEFSKKNFNKLSNQTPFDGSLMLDSPTLRLTARRQVYSKRGFSTPHLPNKRRPKFQTSCRL